MSILDTTAGYMDQSAERDPYMTTRPRDPAPPVDPARQLRETTAAVRVQFSTYGTKKSLTVEQKQRVAEGFDAQERSITAGKKLLNTAHPAYRAVTAVKTQIGADWKSISLPFPEPGIRLIRRADVDSFNARMEAHREAMATAVIELDAHFNELKQESMVRLGSLFNPDDYPSSLVDTFAVNWDFPNVEPPSYLMQLRPDLYESERARVAAQFTAAVEQAEEEFREEFQSAITHLISRLGRGDDGNALVFRDSAVNNLTDFFERFRTLGLRSDPQLDALVAQAQETVRGVTPGRLRTNTHFRETIAANLANVAETLAATAAPRPRRNIVRPNASPAPTGPQEGGPL
jgi:hypothetical protein